VASRSGGIVVTAGCEPAGDEAVDRADDLIEQPGDVVVPRGRQRAKPHGAVGLGREHTVGTPPRASLILRRRPMLPPTGQFRVG